MAFSLIAHATARCPSGGTAFTTSSIDTTGANLIIVLIGDHSPNNSALTDSNSNTWTLLTAKNVEERCVLAYCSSPTVGSGHTFTLTPPGAVTYASMEVQAWSGAASSTPFDIENGAVGLGTTTQQPGSVTPNQANSLVVTGITNDNGGSITINGGFTISDSSLKSVFDSTSVMAYLVQTTATAANPTWTLPSSNPSAVIAVFKPGAAATSVPRLPLLGVANLILSAFPLIGLLAIRTRKEWHPR